MIFLIIQIKLKINLRSLFYSAITRLCPGSDLEIDLTAGKIWPSNFMHSNIRPLFNEIRRNSRSKCSMSTAFEINMEGLSGQGDQFEHFFLVTQKFKMHIFKPTYVFFSN
jgi:hypothetical protein